MVIKRKVSQHSTNIVLGFLNLGFKDYIAARVLLNANLLLQGAVLASASIEKYFKAIIAFRGNISRGHLGVKLFNSVKNFDPKLYTSLNESFLLFLQRCYKLRYFDDIVTDFSLAIVSRPVLAELDYTVSKIEKRFVFSNSKGPLIREYNMAVNSKNPLLYLNNYILNNIDKNTFIALEKNNVYEMRLDSGYGLIEVTYIAEKVEHDGNFLVDALKPSKKEQK